MLKSTESRHFRIFVFASLMIATSIVAAALVHAAQNVQAFV